MHTKAKRKASKADQATFRDVDVVAGAASQGKVQPIFCTLEELYSGCCKTCKVSDSGLSVDVNVPAGSRHGSTIVATEAGAVFSVVEPLHHVFRREGDDLVVVQEVGLQDAVCGVTLLVQHLDGSLLQLEVPPMRILQGNALSHTFWGKGMPRSNMGGGAHGDLVLRVTFSPPTRLPAWQQAGIRAALPGGVLRPGPPLVLKLVQLAGSWAMQHVRQLRLSFMRWLRDA